MKAEKYVPLEIQSFRNNPSGQTHYGYIQIDVADIVTTVKMNEL